MVAMGGRDGHSAEEAVAGRKAVLLIDDDEDRDYDSPSQLRDHLDPLLRESQVRSITLPYAGYRIALPADVSGSPAIWWRRGIDQLVLTVGRYCAWNWSMSASAMMRKSSNMQSNS